ncbi:MAG: DUF5723 family protein [Bacteroides sp.]
MKQYIYRVCAFVLVILLTISVSGQAIRSTYFLKGSTYRHQLNPAFMGERNYIAIPILGNLNVDVQGNIGVSNFIYKTDNPLKKYSQTIFMNSIVDGKNFLSGLNDNNKLEFNFNIDILACGFYAWGGFNTLGINLRSNSDINLPYSLFDFMKTGMDKVPGSSYRINDFWMSSNNYVELALGHSRLINEQLTVGAKLKFLFGVGNIDARFDRMDVTMSQGKWIINANGSLKASIGGVGFKTKASNSVYQMNGQIYRRREIEGFNMGTPGLGGFGLGIDLGATYKMDKFVKGLTLSAALLDLGFISWGNNLKGSMLTESYTFDGFRDITIDDDKSSLGDQVNNMVDDLKEFMKFYDDGRTKSRSTMLSTTINFGAEYALPVYNKLTFGCLSSTYINKPYTWSEGRFSANVAPLSWFDASINYGISNFGSSFGWILNFHPKNFNIFVGSDHLVTKVMSRGVPESYLNANICLGFNISFGKKNKIVK